MRHIKNIQRIKILLGASLMAFVFALPADIRAAAQGSLLSVTEEAQILPIPDGSGKYLLKSDGFYCLKEDGTRDNTPSVHCFDHFVIDGTEFNGYYYHDESGKFAAGTPHMVYIKQDYALVREYPEENQKVETVVGFNGCYMVNNLGRLSAAPQVRYMDNLVMNGVTYNGYYYFDENGRLVTEPGIHHLEMTSNGQSFDGSYYFGGVNGVLVQESTMTPDGFLVDGTGRLEDMEDLGMDTLKPRLKEILSAYEGEWSVYVKNLDTDEEIVINNKPLYSASLIKPFVMAKTYADMEAVTEDEALKIKVARDSDAASAKVHELLANMITVSDNESFNELVRLQTEKNDFNQGAEEVNEFLEDEGYKNTSVQHTLAPSSSPSVGLGGNNTTSVKDCGLLLEQIYNGECVSEEASEEMLDLLLNQQVIWKIPQGIEGVVEGIPIANKTGETDIDQHDIAIVYGEKTTYILCVMSEQGGTEDVAINNIRNISRMVYNYLNL